MQAVRSVVNTTNSPYDAREGAWKGNPSAYIFTRFHKMTLTFQCTRQTYKYSTVIHHIANQDVSASHVLSVMTWNIMLCVVSGCSVMCYVYQTVIRKLKWGEYRCKTEAEWNGLVSGYLSVSG